MSEQLDCLIVGARCAGAPLAMHLTRAGMRVRVLEAAALGSDQAFSTHAIAPLGMAFLDELGLGDAIRAVTPAVTGARMDVRGHHLDVQFPPARAMYCPRRSTLDPILQNGAIAAGVEIRERTRVTGLLREGARVVGVEAERGGTREQHRARFVVGADGRNSTIAKLVGAKDYIEHGTERGGYWAYWKKPRCWDDEEPFRRFQTLIRIDEVSRFVFECDDDLLIMGAIPPYEVSRHWGKDHPARLREALEDCALTAPLCQGEPIAPPVGLLKGHFYFREPVGDGWALVGDAGLHKDPTPGHGITDALRDAKALAAALVDGRPAALELFWRQRDVLSVPLYFQGLDMGRLGFVNPLNELVMDNLQRGGEATQKRMREIFDRERSPFEMVPPLTALAWTARAALRPGVLSAFVATARFNGEVQRELELRKRLLKEAQRAMQA